MQGPLSHLGIVIVTYNNESDLPRCLDSLRQYAPGAHIVVRDCRSTDSTVDLAKQHPAVSQVLTGDNVGFGTACNDAARSIDQTIEFLLILNPDTEIVFDLSDLISHAAELGDFGCVGIQQRSASSHEIVWSWDEFPSVALEWDKARGRKILQRSPEGYTDDRVVDWNMGAFMLFRRESFDAVGGFDERFFMFCEEIDLCMRLSLTGRKSYYVNNFHFLHDRSDKASLWREVLRLNSRRKYDEKWLSRSATLACQTAHTYRWMRDMLSPGSPRDRRLAVPRILATWNLVRAIVPPDPAQFDIDSWHAVAPFWRS
ncbi:glycosyltransferase family 2 protein [Nocardia puris]|uniref:glycosyltransferase family 2 protein n=1 Tax=Nocardia puris TaxID=208602 RepID=UPI002E1C0621